MPHQVLSNNDFQNFLFEVRKGNVEGHSIVHQVGRNPSVPNGSWEIIAGLNMQATVTLLSTQAGVRIRAGGDPADDAAGLGARKIVVRGIASDLTQKEVEIATAGASASLNTIDDFLRISSAVVTECGSYGNPNEGEIIVERASDGLGLICIAAGEGASQFGGYTIPLGKIGFLIGVLINVDSTKPANIRGFVRENITKLSAPFSPPTVAVFIDGALGSVPFNLQAPTGALPPLTDIWFEAFGSSGQTAVSVDFEILLVDNT